MYYQHLIYILYWLHKVIFYYRMMNWKKSPNFGHEEEYLSSHGYIQRGNFLSFIIKTLFSNCFWQRWHWIYSGFLSFSYLQVYEKEEVFPDWEQSTTNLSPVFFLFHWGHGTPMLSFYSRAPRQYARSKTELWIEGEGTDWRTSKP